MYGYEKTIFESDVVCALGAQTEATEALVEEQRTANLIAVRDELLGRARLKPTGPSNAELERLIKLDVQIYTRLGLN